MLKRKSFPFIQQTGMMECGPTCLAMIFKYYGYFNIQSLLTKITEVNTGGVNLYSLAEAAEQFGFQADCYEMEYKNFQEIPLPCIAHYSGIHFIVVYKVTENEVWVADPAYGKDRLSREEFEKKWNGIVLALTPSPNIFKNKDLEEAVEEHRQKQRSLFGKFYAPVFESLKGVLVQILLASALLQVLGLAIPFFTQTIVDYVLVNQNKKLLMVILFGLVAVFSTQVILLYARNILLVHARVHFELEFFSRFFKHFISLQQKFYDSNKREDFMARFQENITIRQLVNPSVIESVVDLMFVLFYIPILLLYNLKLGLLALVFVVLYAGVTLWFTPKIRALAYKVFYRNLLTLGDFLDTLLGMLSVKLLAIENFKFWQWKNKYKHTLNVVMESEQQSAILHSVQRSIYYVSQIGVFWVGAWMTFSNEITIGQYLAITAIFVIVLNSLNNLSLIWYNLTELSVGISRLNDVLIQETESNSVFDRQNDFNCFPLIVKNLNFKYYRSQENYILKNLNLEIKEGEHIGVVGRNGSGKTTLVKLFLNLYPDYEGLIQYGNTDMQRINTATLRKKVFLFPQEIYVFNGTIKENILYGNLDASIDDVIRAAKLADLHDFVSSQYLGYNYKVGDYGANLSGGQRLKIGFARLFLSNPDIIILDEASSMLDVESEQKIMLNIKSHFKNKTVISIAHRMQTLRNANRIWVVDGGQIAEEGSHEDLIKIEGGIYQNFMRTYVDY
ncbi:MAG: peptidase domain-containing ABC transporter [Saprospiraceae bacterium]|nr:peptidase domain-containing ABC transporter [Saprospiraceae bacterium]MBK9629669.1 peptidase domain-containing ABC transporter [Saprospiraceae bacterium]